MNDWKAVAVVARLLIYQSKRGYYGVDMTSELVYTKSIKNHGIVSYHVLGIIPSRFLSFYFLLSAVSGPLPPRAHLPASRSCPETTEMRGRVCLLWAGSTLVDKDIYSVAFSS